jgi:hypothetical protein
VREADAPAVNPRMMRQITDIYKEMIWNATRKRTWRIVIAPMSHAQEKALAVNASATIYA